MIDFHYFTAEYLQDLLQHRLGETKLGERLYLFNGDPLEYVLQDTPATFVLLGLPEDIGVRANGGVGGAASAWNGFLKSFLNIQENEFLTGKDFLVLGHLDFSLEMEAAAHADTEQLRQLTSKVDSRVWPIIQQIVGAGKIPIVIGGGHNNAYPLLKGSALALKQPLNAVNLDAHADFRAAEGRHSGNGFRYAYQEGYLIKYAMLGLHEGYNSKFILHELIKNPDFLPVFWEDIFLRATIDWNTSVHWVRAFVEDRPFGTELDLDSIQNVLSSAQTPVGITVQQAVAFLYQCGLSHHARYLHLPEGISDRADGRQDPLTGKLLSYLVQAFVKGVNDRVIV